MMLSEENNIRNQNHNVQKFKELEIQIIAKKIMFDFDLNVIERLFFIHSFKISPRCDPNSVQAELGNRIFPFYSFNVYI